MTVECPSCGFGAETVYYRRPFQKPRHLLGLKILILLAGFFSFISVFQMVDLVIPLLGAAAQLQTFILANPEPGQEALQDYVQIYLRVVIIFSFALVVALVTIVVRYLLFFIRGFRSGHPKTLNQVQAIAWIQLGIQGLSWLTVAIIFSGLQTIQVAPTLGAGFFIAPVLLWFIRRPALRTYFSAHRVQALPKDSAKPSPTQAWESVPSP